MEIKIKYFNKYNVDVPELKRIEQGDWIDLHICHVRKLIDVNGEDMTHEIDDIQKEGVLDIEQGDVIRFGLGVAMELPDGYEAHVKNRSGTFDKYGLLQTNAVGTIDNSYCGNNDEWLAEYYATRDTVVHLHDRLCQFRIEKIQPDFKFVEVDMLEGKDRGGYGGTGR